MAAVASLAISDLGPAGIWSRPQVLQEPERGERGPATRRRSKAAVRNRRLLRPGRQLHVLDVENLLGGTRFTPAEVSQLRTNYAVMTGMTPMAQVVIGATADASAVASGIGWAGAGIRIRHGRDGADLELLEVLAHENVAERFTDVFIGSGDGIFAPVAAQLARTGSLGHRGLTAHSSSQDSAVRVPSCHLPRRPAPLGGSAVRWGPPRATPALQPLRRENKVRPPSRSRCVSPLGGCLDCNPEVVRCLTQRLCHARVLGGAQRRRRRGSRRGTWPSCLAPCA